LIKKALSHFGRELCLENNDIFVDVLIDRDIYPGDGYASTETDDEYPMDFTIYISPIGSFKDTFLTLAHEMIHVKQYHRGELVTTEDGELAWFNGSREDRWWEDEAYSKETKLYNSFVGRYKKIN